MSRNNDVFQVLIPTSGTIAPAGTTLEALALGQLGAFDVETNLAVDAPVSKYYFAVGVDSTGKNAVKNDIVKSSGQKIVGKDIVSLTNQCYVAPVNMVTNNTMKVISCGGEIGVKLEIRNQEAYRINGYNQVVKTFLVPTSECTDCDTNCEDADCVAVLDSLVALINSDPDGLVVATKADPTNCSTPDGKLILTVQPDAVSDFCDINLNYFSPRQTEIIVTPLEGFEATTIATAMVYEDGAGYDIKQLEYEAGGWNGKPGVYRASDTTGVAISGFQYFADIAKNYDTIHLSYDLNSISGWRGDSHFARTIFATAVDGGTAGNLSEVVGAFINTMTSGNVDAIVACDNTP